MRKKIYMVAFFLLVVVIAGVVGKQYDYLYLANKINVNGLELFMKEKEVIELFGEEDSEVSYCMGCGPNMYYKNLGIFARLSETKQYVKDIKITNPKYDILGIKPNQNITKAQNLLEEMGFKLIDSDPIRLSYQYQKKKLTFEMIIDKQGVIKSVQVEYQVKKDNNIIY
ncbi:hypothetical protein [Neobacillus citreus]|uniref:Uncharacterized protein n=1 Tax=Neobacillus citreus TaxID=2833578 RepID=A0A9J6MXI0_9BACI|nr:hypothetical protein [Neobacillus citreus]MCH6264494.1 hypothetical protein [Neobacillus citreus]